MKTTEVKMRNTATEPKEISREIVISYSWNRDDNKPIKRNHIEALEETAFNRISDQMKEGYTSGELIDCIRMDDEDGDEGIEYSGWYDITTNCK